MENENLQWKYLTVQLEAMSENDLKTHINYEASVHKRRSYLRRLHQRYCALRDKREREQLIRGELL